MLLALEKVLHRGSGLGVQRDEVGVYNDVPREDQQERFAIALAVHHLPGTWSRGMFLSHSRLFDRMRGFISFNLLLILFNGVGRDTCIQE